MYLHHIPEGAFLVQDTQVIFTLCSTLSVHRDTFCVVCFVAAAWSCAGWKHGVFIMVCRLCVSSRLFGSGWRAEPSFHWGTSSDQRALRRRWFPAQTLFFLCLDVAVFRESSCTLNLLFGCSHQKRKKKKNPELGAFSKTLGSTTAKQVTRG